MIESIEGKRGEPRLRPPYVAQVGLFADPPSSTTWRRCTGYVTFSKKDPNGLPAMGGMSGRACSFSVSGRVKKPGVHLARGHYAA